MADFSNPALPLVVGATSGHGFDSADGCAHVLNTGVVKAGIDSISAQIDQQSQMTAVRETLKSQCDLEHSIANVNQTVLLAQADALREACEVKRVINEEGERTRQEVRNGFQRLDDQKIAKLELQLALAKQCGCGCGSTSPGNGNGPGNS